MLVDMRQCVVERLLQLCDERRLTINGLAHVSGIAPSTVKNIVNGVSKNPGVVTIKKLCDGLDISVTEFFNTDTFRTLEQEIR